MALHTLKVHGKRFSILKDLMNDLAAEEFEHAERVERILKDYPQPLPEKGGNRYAQGLRKLWQVRGRDNFLDMLLVCGLIEARSAERFKLLADHARGTPLAVFMRTCLPARSITISCFQIWARISLVKN